MPPTSPKLEQLDAGDVQTRLKNIEETLYDPDKGIFSRISSIQAKLEAGQSKLESGMLKVETLFERVENTLEKFSNWQREDKTDVKLAELELRHQTANLQVDYIKSISDREAQRVVQLDQKVALLEDRLVTRGKDISDLQANYSKLFWAVMTFATSGLAKFIWDGLHK